jgi:hypothetical protein
MSDLTDTAQTTTGDAAAAASPGNGRLVLALIAGIPLTVILAASWMWYFVVNGELDIVGALGTANRGELVQPPRQALDAGWTSPDGTAFALAPAARWTLVIPQADSRCAAGCEARLYRTRQIHQALGKELGRVQRLLVTDGDPRDLQLAVAQLSDERPLPDSFAAYLETRSARHVRVVQRRGGVRRPVSGARGSAGQLVPHGPGRLGHDALRSFCLLQGRHRRSQVPAEELQWLTPRPSTPKRSALASWRDYRELTKPGVVALMILTSVIGMCMAVPGLGAPGCTGAR